MDGGAWCRLLSMGLQRVGHDWATSLLSWCFIRKSKSLRLQMKSLKLRNLAIISVHSVQLLSCVQLFATPPIAARQASLSITNSWSLLKLMSIQLVMPPAIHPLSSPSPPAPNPSQHQSLLQWVNSSHEVAKELGFQLQHQSFQWTPRTDLL